MGHLPQSQRSVGAAGRPRDRHIDKAVLDAAVSVLDEGGYRRLTLEAIARRAGTTKPALYRRWPSVQHLVLDALAHNLGDLDTYDSGCTLCDLTQCMKLYFAAFEKMRPDVLGALLGDCAQNSDLRSTFMTTLFDPPRRAVAVIVDRALARGDLRPDTDRELTLDFLGSLVYYRAVFGHVATNGAEIEQAVGALLQGIATDYPQLREKASQMAGADPQTHAFHGWQHISTLEEANPCP